MSGALNPVIVSARTEVVRLAIDAGTPAPGRFVFYAGAVPVGGAAPPGDEVGRIALALPCGVVSDGVLTFTGPMYGVRSNVGTITWARLVDGDGFWVRDFTVSVTGGVGEVQLEALVGYPGALLTLVAAELREAV